MPATKEHTHPKTEGWRGLLIPADPDTEPIMVKTDSGWQGLAKAIGCTYIERVLTRLMPRLPCGCRCILIVDEVGLISNKPKNERASKWYPQGFGLAGDVLMIAEGPIGDEPFDFVSLPLEIDEDWAGFQA
jgi:hypothetical protein